MQKTNFRSARIASQIFRELAMLLQFGVKDTRITSIGVTHVEVSRDLSIAKVYFSSLDESKIEDLTEALEQAKGFLRSQLAKQLKLRAMPELRFIYDKSIKYGAELNDLIEQACRHDNNNNEH